MAQWWSIALPRRGSRVRIPSRAFFICKKIKRSRKHETVSVSYTHLADGNIKEGNLQKLFRDFSDKANVSMLMIDNSADSSAVYSTARDAKFLRDRMERYIFGKNHMDVKVLEENEAYTLQVTFCLLYTSRCV